MLSYSVIATGSKGNATLVWTDTTLIQIDFGISRKRVTNVLSQIGKDFSSIDAFVITHNHHDHCSDLFNAPVEKIWFSSTDLRQKIDGTVTNFYMDFQPFTIGDITLTPIPLSHDAPHTCGFVIQDKDEKIVHITDTGLLPKVDLKYVQDADYIFIESNYDHRMLYESGRPSYLIGRIDSEIGHLSNEDSGYLASQIVAENTKEIVLIHISRDCNTPEIALTTFKKVFSAQLGYLPDIKISASTQEVPVMGGHYND